MTQPRGVLEKWKEETRTRGFMPPVLPQRVHWGGGQNPSKKESKRVRSEKAKGEGIGLRDQRSPGYYEGHSSTLEKPLWLRLGEKMWPIQQGHERNGEDGSVSMGLEGLV